MAFTVLFTVFVAALGFGRYANAIPTPSTSDSDALAQCNNNFLQPTIDNYVKSHKDWNITFKRTPVTEKTTPTDDVFASLVPVPMANLCSFSVNVKPSDSSNTFNFELMLPQPSQWNHRFLAVGNGAFSGYIERYQMGNGVAGGFATMGTDTGHGDITDGSDETWAKDINKRLDWAYRAMDRSTELAKLLTAAYYGTTINYSYYSGCSTGGRQGLKQVTVNPKTFDGVLIGAPAWDEKHLLGWITDIVASQINAGADRLVDPDDFKIIDTFVMKSCQTVPGYPTDDGLIQNSNVCNATLDWSSPSIRCTGAATTNCLNDNKIALAQKLISDIYTPYTTNRGGLLNQGYFPGSSLQWDIYLAATKPDFSVSYEANFLDMGKVSWPADEQRIIEAIEKPDTWTVDDFSKLNYGGKIILYHGSADGFIPTRSSEYLFNQTSALFPNAAEWFRYFEIPGMQHCGMTQQQLVTPPSGKPVPYYINGASQAQSISRTYVPASAGINDTQHDALLALANWVENATAPASIIATAWTPGTAFPETNNYSKYRQRPICPYPKLPTWKTGTDANLPGNWSC